MQILGAILTMFLRGYLSVIDPISLYLIYSLKNQQLFVLKVHQ